MFADIPDEIKKAEIPEPVIVIGHFGGIGFLGVKIEIFFELPLYAGQVMVEGILA